MSRFTSIPTYSIRRPLTVGLLALSTAALSGCQDDAPLPLAPTSHALASKGGTAGKPGSGEAVAFAGTKDGNLDIYIMKPDGANVVRITTDAADDYYPDFAPDNRSLVWVRSGPGGIGELFTGNVDGSKQAPLTNLGTSVLMPRYSPDGTRIAFVATSNDNGGRDIYTINADGTGLKRLTYENSEELSPTWSPDGTRIAFESIRDGFEAIFVMNADGLNVRPIVCDFGGCGEPAWSPDGNYIAVTGPGGSIHAVNVVSQISTPVGPLVTSGDSYHPTWSKDGTQVLFSSSRGIEGTYEIYTSPPGTTDPTTVRRLTVFSPGDAQTPAYSR
jgi:TolB protein